MLNEKTVYIIAALDAARGIGKDGKMSWFSEDELAHFHTETSREHATGAKNVLIVGRKTWESIPETSHPKFRNRRVIVLSRNAEYNPGPAVEVLHSLDEAWKAAAEGGGAVYIIGGAEIYEQTIADQRIDQLLLTHVTGEFGCDVFFPPLPTRFDNRSAEDTIREPGLEYYYCAYTCSPRA